jgi:anaerobic magnesium-protoporphyrin IX monomethyl ester cyclase
MKIALINPNLETKIYTPWVPLGLLYIGTILKENGFNVKILDAAARSFSRREVISWLKSIDPEIIGFSVFTVGFLPTIKLVKEIKNWNPTVKIILGHYHPTIEAGRIMEKYGQYIDYCVRGEGEFTFLNLCEFLDKNDTDLPYDISGLAFNDGNRVILTPEAPLISDLDELPIPDRKLIDYDYKWNFSGLEFSGSKLTSVVSSRGCPFNCSYCACTTFAKRRFRPRSPENIIEELILIEGQGYTQVNFVDDNFTLLPKRTIKLCELIKKEKIDLNWHTDGRVDQTSQNMLNWMRKAGCRSIWYGFETANQRILNIYNKRTKISQFDEAIRKTRKANIDLIVGLFMLGAPTETLPEIKNTINFAVNSDIDVPFFNVVEIFSGTKFWNDFIAEGKINPKDIIKSSVGGEICEVERWETSTRVIDILLAPKERERILNEIQNAYQQFFSFERKKIFLLKMFLRVLKSKFMQNMASDIFKNLSNAIDAISTFRNSKPRGFGVYDE